MVLVGDLEKLLQTTEKALGILSPGQVMQKHAHGIHADRFRPAQLTVNSL